MLIGGWRREVSPRDLLLMAGVVKDVEVGGDESFTTTSVSTFSVMWSHMTKTMSSVQCVFNHIHRADGHWWEFWNSDISVKVLHLGTWENARWAKM